MHPELGLQHRHRVGAALQALEEGAAEAEPLGLLQGRYGGDIGEMWGRYRGDMGRYREIWWQAAAPPLYLPCISPASPLQLPCSSPISPLQLPYISLLRDHGGGQLLRVADEHDAPRAVLERHERGELARLGRLVEDGRLEAERLEPEVGRGGAGAEDLVRLRVGVRVGVRVRVRVRVRVGIRVRVRDTVWVRVSSHAISHTPSEAVPTPSLWSHCGAAQPSRLTT